MKNRIAILMVVFSLLIALPVFADDMDDYYGLLSSYYSSSTKDITVQLNGENIDFTDSEGNRVLPQIINDRTMVPMRKIFEEFGAEVEWNAEDRSILATKDSLEIFLQIDNTKAIVTKDGEMKEITLDSAPTIVDNRTLVPVRFIAESLNQKVAWDSWDRTVIIIDTSFVEEEIKENASNFYDYITEDYTPLTSFDIKFDINAEFSEDQSTISFQADGNYKMTEDAFLIGGTVEIDTNIEDYQEALKEIPTPIEGTIILDFKNGVIYFKSPILNETGYFELPDVKKWVKFVFDEYQKEEIENMLAEVKEASNKKLSIQELVDMLVTEDTMNTNTYEQLKMVTSFVSIFLNNERFKVTEQGNEKVYNFSLNRDAIAEAIKQIAEAQANAYDYSYTEEELNEYIDEQLEGFDCEVTCEFVIKDHVATGGTVNVSLEIPYQPSIFEDESRIIGIKFDIASKLEAYNKNVKITIPSEKETVDFEDVYHDPYQLSIAGQAQFVGFTTEMAALQDTMYQEATTLNVEEIIRGSRRVMEQVYNHVARGASLDEDEWITLSAARDISCTAINGSYVSSGGSKLDLPTRKVDTANGLKEMNYYVTPKGNVFCWPPYPYDGKSYVSSSVTAVNSNEDELPDTDATKKGTVFIYFDNGETIEITTDSKGNYTIKNEYQK